MSDYDDDQFLPTEEDALLEAVTTVRQLVKTPEQLSRISVIKNKYARHKQQIDMLLSSAVRTQVEEIRFGLELILKSQQVISNIRYQATVIDQVCNYTKSQIPSYTAIQTINIARANVEMARRVLQDVLIMQTHAQQLIRLLDDNDASIKFVYKEFRRLERVKLKAAQQLDRLPDHTIVELVNKFQVVTEIGRLLNQRIWENIEDCLILSEESPTVLIRTLQVIEIEDAAVNKVLALNRSGDDTPVYREKLETGEYIDAPTLFLKAGVEKTRDNKIIINRTGAGNNNIQKKQKQTDQFDTLRNKVILTIQNSIAQTFKPLLLTQREKDDKQKKLNDVIQKKKQEEQFYNQKIAAQQRSQKEQERQQALAKKNEKRDVKEAKRQAKIQAKFKKKEEKRLAKARAREARKAAKQKARPKARGRYDDDDEDDDEFDDDDDDDDDSDEEDEDDEYSDEEDEEDDDSDDYSDEDEEDDSDYSDEDEETNHSSSDSESMVAGFGQSKGKSSTKSTKSSTTTTTTTTVTKNGKTTVTTKSSSSGGTNVISLSDSESQEEESEDDPGGFGFGASGAKKTGNATKKRSFDSSNESGSDDHSEPASDSGSDSEDVGFGANKGKKTAVSKKSKKKNTKNIKTTPVQTEEERQDEIRRTQLEQERERLEELQRQQEEEENEHDALSKILTQLDEFLPDLDTAREYLVACFPPSYDIEKMFTTEYLKWFRTVLTFNIQDVSRLGKKSLLQLIKFTEVILGASNAQYITPEENEYFERMIVELMDVYVLHSKTTIISLIDNLLSTQELVDPVTDENGHYITTGPQDLFNILQQQLSLNLSHGLKGKSLFFIGVMFAEVIEYFQSKQIEFITSIKVEQSKNADGEDNPPRYYFGRRKILRDEAYFCAMLNNSGNAIEYTERLCQEICNLILREEEKQKKSNNQANAKKAAAVAAAAQTDDADKTSPKPKKSNDPDSSDDESMKNAADELSDDDMEDDDTFLQNMSTGAGAAQFSSTQLTNKLRLLYEQVAERFDDVCVKSIDVCVLFAVANIHPHIASLFKEDWLDGHATPAMITAIEQEFDSFDQYIVLDAHFTRVVNFFMVAFVLQYCRQFAVVRPVLDRKDNNNLLLPQLQLDKVCITRLFTSYKDSLGAATIAAEVAKLEILYDLLTTDPEFLSLYFGKLSESFPSYCREILEGVLSVRNDLSKSQKKDILIDLTSNMDTINFLQEPESKERAAKTKNIDELVKQAQRDDKEDEVKTKKSWWFSRSSKSPESTAESAATSSSSSTTTTTVTSSTTSGGTTTTSSKTTSSSKKGSQPPDDDGLTLDDFLD